MKVVMPRTLALTGSTGFIGTALLRKLTSAGWSVRALCRSAPRQSLIDHAGGVLEWIYGGLEDRESLRHLVQGTTAVVHCAGAIRGASAGDFSRVNVDGVARLVQAAKELHPLPRFLLISSLAAREPLLSYYAASKRNGEHALRSSAAGMMWMALRPPAVYGPGDRETLPLVRCLQRGMAPVLGRKGSRFSLLFVEDLADAVRHMLELPRWSSDPFEIHDGHTGGYGWEDLTNTVARIIRKPVRRFRIPVALMQAAARGNLCLSRAFGYAPMLTPGKVRELTHPDWVCDDAALRRATGWTPRFLLEAGMRQTLKHLRGGRWVLDG
jgi:nucleoside-diphosphate-sugar epimerase